MRDSGWLDVEHWRLDSHGIDLSEFATQPSSVNGQRQLVLRRELQSACPTPKLLDHAANLCYILIGSQPSLWAYLWPHVLKRFLGTISFQPITDFYGEFLLNREVHPLHKCERGQKSEVALSWIISRHLCAHRNERDTKANGRFTFSSPSSVYHSKSA